MYKLAIKISLDKKFKKFRKKDKDLLHLINRKVQDILNDPHRFKPLRKKLLQNKKCLYTQLLCVNIESKSKKTSQFLILTNSKTCKSKISVN